MRCTYNKLLSVATTLGIGLITASIALGGAGASAAQARGAAKKPAPMRRVWVSRAGHRIAAYEQPGTGPAIVLAHGFPDNHHLYDRLLPYLRGRHVVSFDFLGWGASDKPKNYNYTFAGQEQDLDAVIAQLHLGRVALVGHDSSVPTVINWTLDHPGRTTSLVVSNGFYAPVQNAGPPALVGIFSLGQYPLSGPLGPLPAGTAYGLKSLLDGLGQRPKLLGDLVSWEESTFIERAADARHFVPLFTRQFVTQPSSYGPLRKLTSQLFRFILSDAGRLDAVARLGNIAHVVWGAKDPNLNLNVARALHDAMPGSTLTVFPKAHHNLMIDEPARFAAVLGQG